MATYQSKYTGAEIDAGIAAANGAMPKNGGTMLGALMLARDPEDEREAAPKKYVDDAIRTIELTPGPEGEAGVPATHSWEGTVLTVTSASGTSSADLKGEPGAAGQAGEAGFSPTVAVATIVGGHRVTITDADGAKSFEVMDGKDGTGGEGGSGIDGENGATFYPSVSSDGILSWTNDKQLTNPDPVNIRGEKGDRGDPGGRGTDGVSVTHSWDGTTLTISSASGTSSANLKGEKGDKGEQGEPGNDATMPNYSTGEVNTGTKWIDGKTIYRRVISATTSSSSFSEIGTIANVNKVVNISGTCVMEGSTSYNTIPFVYFNSSGSITNHFFAYVQEGSVKVKGSKGFTAYVIVDYTKTT